jgi:KTSC domain
MAERQISIKESSNIQAVFHDPDTQVLRVIFKQGGEYSYEGVDSNKADAFATADSPGRYLHANIKGQHTHKKL